MEILTTRNFNGVQLDCYEADNPADDFWATREQIGRLLGYSEPEIAIGKIHNRNTDRINKFSTLTKMVKVEGSRTVTREVIVYNFKGLLEICRYSNQPKANEVIDFLWNVADDIRKHGMYISDKVQEIRKSSPDSFKLLLDKYLAEREKNRELQKTIDDERAYTQIGHLLLSLPGSVTVKEAADLLAQHGIDIGQNRLFKRLRDDEWCCKRKGKQWNKPTKKAIDKGLLNVQVADGFNAVTMVTPKGFDFLSNLFVSENYPLVILFNQGETEK